jgi:hypothetical protein
MLRIFSLSLVSLFIGAATVFSAPASDLWPRWQKHNPENSEVIDHSVWQIFLDKYLVTNPLIAESPKISGINRVRYAGVSKIDYGLLKNYLTSLEDIPVSNFSRPQQRAFWINLYNAATVNLILEHYPLESITKISFSFFSFGPWDEELLSVEGEELSLNDIEHRILRPIWQDTRIHYALNCASLGCPNLLPQAFTELNTESLLEQGAHDYINHPRGANVQDDSLILSKIYDWYQADFGGNEDGVLLHLQQYSTKEWLKSLQTEELEIEYQYDWRLNAADSGKG